MLTLILDHRHCHLPAVDVEPLPDDTAAVRGIALGVAISVAFYAAVALIWWLA